MAETLISAIIGDAVSRAISLIVGRFNQESTKAKLQTICDTLIRIHSVVEEAKGRHITNDGTLQWLSELISSEYQGRYLLDCFRYGDQEDHRNDKVVPHVSTLSLFNPAKRVRVAGCAERTTTLSFCHDLSVDEIDRVLERLRVMSHDLRKFIMLLQNCQPIRQPLATNFFREGQMFGRHVEKERIINFLLHEDDPSFGELGVLPIVGGSGVGKTTLMQHACDDARVRNHFPVILLHNFSCTYIVKKNEGTQNDPLKLVNGKKLRRKRFLLVLEVVDFRRNGILKELLQSLRLCKERSKVIITTNDRRVATFGTVEPIILTPLPFPEYWFFFKAQAFAGRDMEENPRLIAAGNEIARKLNGSFFGAKIVGGLLRDHMDPKFWCKVLRSNIGGISPLGDCISYISDLADSLLPGHVDMCRVTTSKGQFSPQMTELVAMKDLCSVATHHSKLGCWADGIRFSTALLCKSVLPFYNHYYIARCTCTCSVGQQTIAQRSLILR